MKRLFIILTIVAVIIAAVFLFMTFFPQEKKLNVKNGPVTGTLASLTASGENVMCTWEKNEDGGITKGTVYISKKNFRSNSQVSANGISLSTYLIGNGEKVYAWSSLNSTQGSAIDYEIYKNPTNKDSIFNSKDTYICTPWEPDPALFTLPTGINFK